MNSEDKQVLTQIRNNIYGELKKIDELIEPKEPITNLKAVRKDDHILVTFDRNTEKPIDIQFSFANGKWHSVVDMLHHPDYNPPVPGSPYKIGNAERLNEECTITVGTGDRINGWFTFYDSKTISLDKVEVPDQPDEPVDASLPSSAWYGLWDSWNYSGGIFNTTKTEGISDAIGVDGNVFISFSHRWKGKTRQQWESMLRGFVSTIEALDPSRTIILLQDEGLSSHHGFTTDELQFLYDTAKALLPDYQFGFTFTRNTISKRELPKSDWVMLATYPFFRADYPDIQVWSKAEFDAWFDSHIRKAREKHDGDIFVIGQGFYNPDSNIDRRRKWRKPPLEAPSWYAEAVRRNNLSGLIWWFWQGNRQNIGLRDMPDYLQQIQNISE